MLAIALLATASLAGCGAESTSNPTSSTERAPSSEPAPSTTVPENAFCTDLEIAVNGMAAVGGGSASGKNSAGSMFSQLATYLQQLVPAAPEELQSALSTMAASFKKASTALAQEGGTTKEVFADPAYLAATKQFADYYTTNCQSSGS
ncbi:MAG: hypothetical protein WCH93_09765 [Actinomycetota bacterium]